MHLLGPHHGLSVQELNLDLKSFLFFISDIMKSEWFDDFYSSCVCKLYQLLTKSTNFLACGINVLENHTFWSQSYGKSYCVHIALLSSFSRDYFGSPRALTWRKMVSLCLNHHGCHRMYSIISTYKQLGLHFRAPLGIQRIMAFSSRCLKLYRLSNMNIFIFKQCLSWTYTM